MNKLIPSGILTAVLISTAFLFQNSNGKETPPAPLENWLLQSEKNTIKVFEERAPLVVFVHNMAFRRDFFSFRATEVQQGAGSGFIWDGKGHIVTNFHVVQNASRISITLKNGKMLKAKLVGAEPKKDLAVLKVNPKYLPKVGFSAKVAKSATVRVGQKTIAIGNPFGLDHTLTVGHVSALNRSFETFQNVTIRDMIQTDAAINPGNSGGPLLDSRGFLMGMNTGIFSNSGSSAGVGFAVPSETIERFVSQIIKHGKVIQPGLGIYPMDQRRARYLGVSTGVLIEAVAEGSSADDSGLRGTYIEGNYRNQRIVFGDVIIGIENDDIDNFDDLYNALIKRKVGDRVKVRYVRDGKEREVRITLSEVNN